MKTIELFDSEYKNELSHENGMGIMLHMLKLVETANLKEFSDFQITSGNISERFRKSGCKILVSD